MQIKLKIAGKNKSNQIKSDYEILNKNSGIFLVKQTKVMKNNFLFKFRPLRVFMENTNKLELSLWIVMWSWV